jgi:DNA-binding protein HU-beta
MLFNTEEDVWRWRMTQSQMTAHLADRIGITKRQAKSALDELNDLVTRQLKKEGSLRLAGLGVFRKRKLKARLGRNPATGEQIKIPARTGCVYPGQNAQGFRPRRPLVIKRTLGQPSTSVGARVTVVLREGRYRELGFEKKLGRNCLAVGIVSSCRSIARLRPGRSRGAAQVSRIDGRSLRLKEQWGRGGAARTIPPIDSFVPMRPGYRAQTAWLLPVLL